MKVFFVVVYCNKKCYTRFMNDEAQKLGDNLKKIRTKKGITQIEISKKLGVNRSFVSNLENGKTNPTLATITKLAQVLGVSTNELLK